MNKCLVLFVEGDTEVEFYKQVVANVRKLRPTGRFNTKFASKPPIKWDEVKRELINNGASKIIHVQANRSIEDWFLCDTEGILEFLRLNKNTKVSGKSGYDKLQHLYKQANKVYYKGIQSNGMIGRLDIEKIANAVKDQLNPLYKALGVDKN